MTDRMLVQCASRGDLDAFEELVRRYQSAAIAYAFSILTDYHAAEDAAQKTGRPEDSSWKSSRRLERESPWTAQYPHQ